MTFDIKYINLNCSFALSTRCQEEEINMKAWKEKYRGLVLDDRETSTHTLFERLADGKGLDCKVVVGWQQGSSDNPSRLMPNQIRIIIYAIRFHKSKTEFSVDCYVFGDLPIGLKPGKFQLTFNRFCTCRELPAEMFETDDEVMISVQELYDPLQEE